MEVTTFDELNLDESLLKALRAIDYTVPSPIQARAIPVALTGVDLIGQAQTGTGKTAAFGIPMIQNISREGTFPRGLVLCPTRELCIQVTNELKKLAHYSKHVTVFAIYGGDPINPQIKALKSGVDIVVGTPGRVMDHIGRGTLILDELEILTLDEADEMLNMGFRDDIDFVLKNTVNRESIWLFSATMPPEVRAISRNFMESPKEVTVGKKNSGNANIVHNYYICAAHQRYETLKRLIDFNPGMYGIIFSRTKADAQEISERLSKAGYDIEALHGDLTQQQRDKVMGRFRAKTLQLLIATDVAARGIDVDGITHVINYELPDDMEVYTHRSGRTARAGKSGISISICHVREIYKIRQLEKMVNASFHKVDIPLGKEVCRKQFFHFMDRLIAADISNGDYETFLPDLMERFAHVSKEEVLQRVAALEFSHFLKYYENAEDLNVKESRTARNDNREYGKPGNARRERGNYNNRDNGFTRLFINLGTKDGFYKASFLQFILDESNLKKDTLGKIDLREMNSWVEVDRSVAGKMIRSLDGKRFNNRAVRMNEADGGFKRPSDDGMPRGGNRTKKERNIF